ncbi:hypothetical protein TraAM80_00414 [Trypanosoma rangeli]|uniref:Uncharacterized protein n=1 Tax=Trypanosoma rangeli TaxID=5698 RepID=A0A422P3G4_TRYRA|nr:uncharacterized protein TraAM80_00414 [Trypanosoma rangeli]RNF12266.1 hypothetical protein TraAM80_00414 [Trypanosoma rangeli]|eukprot:RNF12266.1 hypothetical protein TraAM80_00414 [Trypanosoma rangeli]
MPSGEPQFATVSLLLGDAVEGTFRVPITDETTVRRLAKDAMRRLLARYSAGRHVFQQDRISVTEVFVKTGSNRAEIFAQDLVNQVVLIKEEVLYMRLHRRERVEAETGEDSLATTETTERITTGDNNRDTCMNAKAVSSVDVHSKSEELSQEKKNLADTGKPGVHVSSVPAAAAVSVAVERQNEEEVKRETEEGSSSAAGVEKGNDTRRGLGWGPEAHKNFPNNYIASPNRLMRKPRTKRKTTTKEETPSAMEAEAKSETAEKESLPETNVVAQPTRGLAWGPEAGKYFPDNYVTSPDRIARIRSREKRLEKKKRHEEEEAARQLQKKKEEEARLKQNTAASLPTFSKIMHSLERRLNEDQHHDTPLNSNSTVMTHGSKAATSQGDKEPRTAPTAIAVDSTPHTNHENGCRHSTGLKTNRKRRFSEIEGGGSASCPIIVERQLSFEAEDAAITHTPQEQSTRRLLEGTAGANRSQQKVPPGWGKEATRYFDVDTYFDDPSKAKLSPEILARPVRARRDVVLPYYFAAISK